MLADLSTHHLAAQAGDQEALEKYSKRTVKVTREHNEECKRLLSLMGVPYVEVCACRRDSGHGYKTPGLCCPVCMWRQCAWQQQHVCVAATACVRAVTNTYPYAQ